jgi:hypothetical protein
MPSRTILFATIVATMASASAWALPDCSAKYLPTSPPQPPTVLPPLSSELPYARPLGSPDGVLVYSGGEAQSVDRVLQRLRAESCRALSPAAGYVPKTKWDNTPYRFNAGGNGKKFKADDFDAWMKANGIHISTGPAQPAPAASPVDSQPPMK